jgi:hypothetical protein
MKSQLLSTFQNHSFVRFLLSLQPAIHPSKQSPNNPPIHQPTHPHIYLHYYFSIHVPVLAPSFILTFRICVAVGDPLLQREPLQSFGRVTFTWYSLYIFVAWKPTTVRRQRVAPSIVSQFIFESKFMTKNMAHFNCMALCTTLQLMAVITIPASWYSF